MREYVNVEQVGNVHDDEKVSSSRLTKVASFDSVTNWAHESLPGRDDMFAVALGEWVPIASTMNGFGK